MEELWKGCCCLLMLITVGSESFPCLACYLHLGFNKEGARIHFSVSYIIIWDALIAQQYHPDFGIGFDLGLLVISRNPRPFFSQRGQPFREE